MLKSDNYLSQVFPEPPLTAFRKQRTLKNILILTKAPNPPKRNSPREIKGSTKCDKSCPGCPYMKPAKEVNVNGNEKWVINNKLNCETYNCIYLIECQLENFKAKYVGQTKIMDLTTCHCFRFYFVNPIFGKHRRCKFHFLSIASEKIHK